MNIEIFWSLIAIAIVLGLFFIFFPTKVSKDESADVLASGIIIIVVAVVMGTFVANLIETSSTFVKEHPNSKIVRRGDNVSVFMDDTTYEKTSNIVYYAMSDSLICVDENVSTNMYGTPITSYEISRCNQ